MRLPIALLGFLAAPVLLAAELHIEIDLPRLEVANYQRPYVAFWLETPDHQTVIDLDVWYNPKQSQWLNKLSQWWMRSGRRHRLPIDGISAATRPVGLHQLIFTDQTPPLANLPAGSYLLMVEVSRELGRRELLQFPFTWPAAQPETYTQQGQSEVGVVRLNLLP